MKLAYVSVFDPFDIHAWSGTGTNILSSLRGAGLQIETIGNLVYEYDFIYKAKEIIYKKIFSKRYHVLWDAFLLKSFARQIENRLIAVNPDLIFSVWANPIAYLRTDKPMVFWGDATLPGLMGLYPAYQNLCLESIRDGFKAEQLALSNCRLAIYSSEWAANTALQYYKVDPGKVKVVPLGANIQCNRTVQDICESFKEKHYDICRLLFVGVDWFRKGGDIALKVTALLRQREIPAELHVVGCIPPHEAPDYVKLYGFVSKTTTQGRQLLDDLYSRSHFLIVPTRAEAYGVVFAEASSFGLPSLTTNVGGIPSVVRDGKNGNILPLNADPDSYCKKIEQLWNDRQAYESFALSAYQEYAERLNWKVAGEKVHSLLYELAKS